MDPAGTPVRSLTLLAEEAHRDAVAAGARRGLTLAKGTAQADRAESWQTKGCSGFGARLLADLAVGFVPPGRSA